MTESTTLAADVFRKRWAQALTLAAILLGPGAWARAQDAVPPSVEARPSGVPSRIDPAPPEPAIDPRAPNDAGEARDTWGVDDRAPSSPKGAPVEKRVPQSTPAAAPCAECLGVTSPRRVDEAAVRYTLEAIEVRGNTRTSTRVVLRYLPIRPGDVLDVDNPALELSRFRLLGTGFFRDVQFSLRKGSERGLVVLVVDVSERNTIVVNDISLGLSADAQTDGSARRLTAYAGLDVAETNLGGTGITLGTAAAIAEDQRAIRVRFLDPAFSGGPWMTSGMLLFNHARDFFGNADVRYTSPPFGVNSRDPAVVSYKRFGGSLGLGRDLSISTQLWVHYRLETIDADYPRGASHLRGFAREPIDFDVVLGRSVLSTLSGTLQHDTRDHPFLPTQGWLFSFRSELSLLPAALDYDYQRFEIDASHWWRLPWKEHVLRLGIFAGGIAGNAPFFERFYVGDYTDLLPDRVLGMNFDKRPPPNFLGTEIVEVRYGDYALKLSAEYRIPLYRGKRSIFGIDAFATAGVYSVAGRRDLTDPPRGYSGLARFPVDLTGNVGLRMDTSAGGFAFAFSNVLSFIPVRGEGPAGGK